MATENGPYQVAPATGEPSGAIDLCPYLQLAGDPDTAATYPRADHRCVRLGDEAISSPWQRQYCVSRSHVRCPYYLGQRATDAHRERRGWFGGQLRRGVRIAGLLIGLAILALVVLQITTGFAPLGSLPTVGAAPDSFTGPARAALTSQSNPGQARPLMAPAPVWSAEPELAQFVSAMPISTTASDAMTRATERALVMPVP